MLLNNSLRFGFELQLFCWVIQGTNIKIHCVLGDKSVSNLILNMNKITKDHESLIKSCIISRFCIFLCSCRHFCSAFSPRINWLLKFGLYPSNIDSISPWLSIDYCSEGQALSVKRFFNSAGYSIKYRPDKTMFSITGPASMISQ